MEVARAVLSTVLTASRATGFLALETNRARASGFAVGYAVTSGHELKTKMKTKTKMKNVGGWGNL
jgi:hypothetical protein